MLTVASWKYGAGKQSRDCPWVIWSNNSRFEKKTHSTHFILAPSTESSIMPTEGLDDWNDWRALGPSLKRQTQMNFRVVSLTAKRDAETIVVYEQLTQTD